MPFQFRVLTMLDIFGLLNASYVAQALYATTSWGVMDHLYGAGPATVDDLAQACAVRPDVLRPALVSLKAFGYVNLEAESGRWSIGNRAAKMFEGEPELRDYVLLWGKQLGPVAAQLETLGRTADTTGFALTFGEPIWDYYRTDRQASDLFVAYMDGATRSHVRTSVLAEALQLEDARTVVDVGGASARLMASVLATYGNLTGTVFDQHHLEPVALRRIAEEGLEARCGFVGGSFLSDPLPAGADAYLIKHVLHDWNDEGAAAVLSNIANAMRPDSKLYIIEGLLDEGSKSKLWLKTRHLEQVLWTGGKVRSEKQFAGLLERAGLVIDAIRDTDVGIDCTILVANLTRV